MTVKSCERCGLPLNSAAQINPRRRVCDRCKRQQKAYRLSRYALTQKDVDESGTDIRQSLDALRKDFFKL